MRNITATAIALALLAGPALAEYPERPITMIVPWAAGGGTDAVARMLAQEMQANLGQPVNVVNREGAGAIVGHSAMIEAEPDGYTIGLATAEITTYAAMGTSSISAEQMTPIALVNFDASAFNIAADSPWQTVEEALADIGANPGRYLASGMPVGAAYHLAFAGFMQAHGVDPLALTMVPSQGAAPGFQELAAGGVHVVPSSLPEAQAMRDAGRVRTLAVLSAERLASFPDVPTAEEATGVPSVGGTWRGVVGPAGLPEDVLTRLETAVKAAYDSAAFQEFMAGRGFGVQFLPSAEFGAFMADAAATNAQVIEALGLVQ
jgi:tripartite-type tricarboxylate transporter receptor subunit TctC